MGHFFSLSFPKPFTRILKIIFLIQIICLVSILILCGKSTAVLFKNCIEKYNKYLNNLTAFKAHLEQISPKNIKSCGTLYIEKPGKLRLIYEPQGTIELISNGESLIQYDGRTKDRDSFDMRDTPLYFLLQKGKLEDLAIVQQVIQGPKWTQIIVQSKENPTSGTITLVFQENPLQLIRWIISDEQGQKTAVTLSNIQTNIKIDPKTFKMSGAK